MNVFKTALDYKNWFSKKEDTKTKAVDHCTHNECLLDLGQVLPEVLPLPDDFIMGNPTCLIIDDNYGQVSVLTDDLESIMEKHDIKNVNILPIHTNMGAFEVNDLLHKYGNALKVEYVIADLTIGGSQRIGDKNVKLNGVDVIGFLKNHFENLKIIIYTGNNLNRYIETNARMANKFKLITGSEIDDYVILKRDLTINERRIEFAKRLFGKK